MSEASAEEVRAAFGNLADATLAGLAGATPAQKERIEQFILRECYPMHASPAPAVPLKEQANAARREVAMRRRVYPRWVAAKKMPQAKADAEIAAMEAIVETLVALIAEREPELFR